MRDREARPAPDLVERNFVAAARDRLWVADITYIPTWAGFLYLAVVLDTFSRRIVGWAMETLISRIGIALRISPHSQRANLRMRNDLSYERIF